MATSLGSVTGQVRAVGTRGRIAFIEAGAGAVVVRSGDGSGTIICNLAINEKVDFSCPPEFDGLNLSASAVVHLK